MNILDLAKRDLKNITGNLNGFGVALTFTSRKDATVATIAGLHSRHFERFNDVTGEVTNTVTAHCSFSEILLTEAGYTVRSGNEVDMKGDTIEIMDSSGITRKYKIQQVHPDETLGFIRCQLSDSE